MGKYIRSGRFSKFYIGKDNGNRVVEVTSTAAELNLMDGVTATTAEINDACDKSTGAIVSITDDITITQALHANKTLVLNKAAGIAVTMPEATGTGDVYTFELGTALTSNTHTITLADTTNADYAGVANAYDADNANIWEIFVAKQSNGYDIITMNMTTQGGITIGFDKVVLTDIATDVFAAVVTLYVPQGSEPATPFSTTA